MNNIAKTIITKLFLSIIAYIPCMWFGFVMHICLLYLGVSSIIAYIGLFVFYPLTYGIIWLHNRKKVVRYWMIFMCVFAVISLLDFIIFAPADNQFKYQFMKMFM